MTLHRAIALALTLALSGAATAGTLSTPPAAVGGTSSLGCLVQSLDRKERLVTARLLDQNGLELDEQVAAVDPGAVVTIVNSAASSFGVYCQFEGLSKKLRGFLHLYGPDTSLLLPATK
jgi:hypothetical protein